MGTRKRLSLDDSGEVFDRVMAARNETEAKKALSLVFSGYPDISFSLGRGRTIYWRARKSSSDGFDNARDMWCPPAQKAAIGRLNNSGQQTLYLSGHIETALCEIGAQVGDYVHLAGFRVLADRQLHVAAIGELMHVQKLGYMRSVGADPGNTLARILNGYDYEEALAIVTADAFLAHVLSDPLAREKNYLHTRMIWHLALMRTRSIGLFYPSVRNHLGLNLAVKGPAASGIFHGVSSVLVKVKRELRFGYFDFDVVKTAIGETDNGTYLWQKPEDSKSLVVYRMSKEEHDEAAGARRTLLDLPTHRRLEPDDAGIVRRFLRRLIN